MIRIKNKRKQYLFKNKLNIRRKSKRELLIESFLMMIIGVSLLLINYIIPQKILLFNSLKKNIMDICSHILKILSISSEILIVIFISFTILLSLFLMIGSINRIIKVMNPKSRRISIR